MHLLTDEPYPEALMLWLIALALLVSYYAGPTTFSVVSVLSILFIVASIAFTFLGLKPPGEREHG